MYIGIDQVLGCDSYLLKFGSEHFKFLVGIGADGAPFGEHDEVMAWLVSFLNSGDRITSHNENFLIDGGNCIEGHVCMKRYARKIPNDIQVIESKEYFVSGHKVTFSFVGVKKEGRVEWEKTF